jgi:transposase InsO family protein
MKDFCQRKGIRLIFSPPYSPQSNGLAERSVQTFKILLSKFNLEVKKRQEIVNSNNLLLDCLFAYRSTPSSITGKSPMSVLLNFEPRVPLSSLKKTVTFKEELVDNHVVTPPIRNVRSYHRDQIVWINPNKKSNVSGVNFELGRIVEKVSDFVYLVKLANDVVFKVHVNQIRELYSNAKLSNALAAKIPDRVYEERVGGERHNIERSDRNNDIQDVRKSARVIRKPNRYSDSNFK